MRSRIKALARVGVASLFLLLAPPAQAADFFVDPLRGSNVTGTGSPEAPWRTVTHALSRIPGPALPETHTLYLLPGSYDVAAGEVFPLVMRAGIHVRAPGPQYVALAGSAGATVLRVPEGVDILIEGLLVRSGLVGLEVAGRPAVRRCHVTANVAQGVLLSPGSGPLLDECTIFGNGLSAVRGEGSSPTILRTLIAGNGGDAVRLERDAGQPPLLLDSVLLQNGGSGVVSAGARVAARNCLIARNQGDGCRNSLGTYEIINCTIADNAGSGIMNSGGLPGVVQNTIAWNNAQDLDGVTGAEVGSSNFLKVRNGGPSPPTPGVNGCVSMAPQFLDPQNFDYRLSAVSPMIDRGNNLAPNLPPTDIEGEPRLIDGTGTTRRATVDIGADEFATLRGGGDSIPGGVPIFSIHIPSNAGLPYRMAVALATAPGIMLGDGRIFPLALDHLLLFSLDLNHPVFDRFQGVLDGFGRATGGVRLRYAPPLVGVRFFGAAVTHAGGTVIAVTNPVTIWIRTP